MDKGRSRQTRALIVSAAALMLGASEASTTIGLAAAIANDEGEAGLHANFQAEFAASAEPTISVLAPTNNTVVTSNGITVRGTSSRADSVTIINPATYNTFYASPVNGYSLNHWAAEVTDLTPGTNEITIQAYNSASGASSAAVSRIVLYAQPIFAGVNGPGKMSPNLEGKPLIAGRQYKVTAVPTAGGKFVNWSVVGAIGPNGYGGYSSPAAPTLTFTMTPGMSLTANFTEVSKPTVTIERTPKTVKDSLLQVAGSAQDKFAVKEVFLTLNGQPVTLNSVSGLSSADWGGFVYLAPGRNEISAYAVNFFGGYSKTNIVVVTNLAKTLSPGSLDHGLMTLTEDLSGAQSEISFGLGAYVGYGGDTNGDSMGAYTYAQTSVAGVEILEQGVSGAPGRRIEAAFRDATSGSYSVNGGQSSGSFKLIGQPGYALPFLNGFSFYTLESGISNYFGDGMFDYHDGQGDRSSGSYVFSQITQDSDWIAEETDGDMPETNYYYLHFGLPTPTFDFFAAGQPPVSDLFYLAAGERQAGLPPLWLMDESLIGTKPRDSLVLTFDTATFALSSANTNDPVGVGLYTFTQMDAKHAHLHLAFLNPPGLAASNITLDLAFSSKTLASATMNGGTYHFTLSNIGNLLPLTLSGHTITTRIGQESIKTSFVLNGFNDTSGGAGTYTLAPYSPHAGLLTLNYAAGNDAGATLYVQLTFGAATSGTFLRTEAGTPAETGTFTFK